MRRLIPCSLLLFALLAACINLGASSPAPRYYLLSDLAESPANIGQVANSRLRLQIAPVALAPFLDRAQLVSRQGNRLVLAESALWGEPLRNGVARVVGSNLERLRPGLRSSSAPMSGNGDRLELYLEVRRCDGRPGETAFLEVRWRVKASATGELRGSGEYSRELAPAVDDDALVEGYSQGLVELSRQIAASLP